MYTHWPLNVLWTSVDAGVAIDMNLKLERSCSHLLTAVSTFLVVRTSCFKLSNQSKTSNTKYASCANHGQLAGILVAALQK